MISPKVKAFLFIVTLFSQAMALSPLAFAQRQNSKEWIFRIHFGPSRTLYGDPSIQISSPTLNARVNEVTLYERTSFSYYEVWKAKSIQDAFRFIDEPTNRIYLEAEKQGLFAVGISYFHPKFLITNHGALNDHTTVGINYLDNEGTLGGTSLNDYFQDYRLTKGFVNVEGYFDLIVKIREFSDGQVLEWRPGLQAGAYFGYATVKYRQNKNNQIESVEQPPTMQYMGPSVSVHQKLSYTPKNDRYRFQLGGVASLGRLNYKFLNGEAGHTLHYTGAYFTVGVRIGKRPLKK